MKIYHCIECDTVLDMELTFVESDVARAGHFFCSRIDCSRYGLLTVRWIEKEIKS